MKCIFFILLLASSVVAEELPPAPQILAAARAQLPSHPIQMIGTLKEWAANGFMKKALSVEINLNWGAAPPQASYHIRDKKSGDIRVLDIRWLPAGPEYLYSENGKRAESFDPNSEINGLGITWADLSFSFLWDPDAETLGIEKKFGKKRFKISVPHPPDCTLLLWIEKETGRMVKAEEYDAGKNRVKTIKVVSVKEFDDIWMVKDLDIIHPDGEGKTSLRVDSVEVGS